MKGYLVDTNVISEFARDEPDSAVIKWFRAASPELLSVSAITLGELRYGVEDLPHGKRRQRLERWLDTELRGWFESNMLPVTRNVAERWARLTVAAKRQGRVLHIQDAFIAATAAEHGLTLVTRNTKDFASLGLSLLNPWS